MERTSFSESYEFFYRGYSHAQHIDLSRGTVGHHLGYLTVGSGKIVTLDGYTLTLRTGDIFYIPPGLRYNSYWEGEPVEYLALSFITIPDPQNREFPLQVVECDAAIPYLKLLCTAKQVTPLNVGLFHLLFDALLPAMSPAPTDSRQKLVQRALLEMESRSDDFAVADIARACNVSETGLYAAFHDLLGSTPVREKNRIRAARAVELLRNTDRSVEDVSHDLGFCSAAYLRRVLLATVGKTPREIRKERSEL